MLENKNQAQKNQVGIRIRKILKHIILGNRHNGFNTIFTRLIMAHHISFTRICIVFHSTSMDAIATGFSKDVIQILNKDCAMRHIGTRKFHDKFTDIIIRISLKRQDIAWEQVIYRNFSSFFQFCSHFYLSFCLGCSIIYLQKRYNAITHLGYLAPPFRIIQTT